MKKMTKRVVSLGLAAAMAFSLTACNKPSGNDGTTAAPTQGQTQAQTQGQTEAQTQAPTQAAEIVKPESIKIIWDGTIFAEGRNYAFEFYSALENKLGIKLNFVRPDHAGYSDQIGIAFNDKNTLADVVLLPAAFYASYAAQGNLWNMTEAWENSQTYKSGRLIGVAQQIIDSWYVVGPDGQKGIYGMYPARGNGCVTYVNASLARKAGYTEDTLPTTWAEYQEFLLAMKEVTGAAPVLAAGLMSDEAPYTNYLPEFYQDAYPDFYYDEASGKWIDGFATDAMAAALDRLAWGYSNGVIDAAILEKPSTSDTRKKFFTGTSTSVFTYWAGTWAYNIVSNLAQNDIEGDEEIWTLEPIAELGSYLERLSPMICITSACKNPEGVFKYFVDTILDGSETQMLWQYGVEGVHYDYVDGVLKGNPTEETKDAEKKTLTKKNLFESQLKLGDFDPAVFPDGDPGYASTVTNEALASFVIFDAHSKMAPLINSSDLSRQYAATLLDTKMQLVAKATKGEMTGAEAVAKYLEEVGAISEAILDSFNNPQ